MYRKQIQPVSGDEIESAELQPQPRDTPPHFWTALFEGKTLNTWQYLQMFSFVTALFHLIQGIIFVILVDSNGDLAFPLEVNYIKWPNMTLPEGERQFSFQQKSASKLSIGALIGSFFYLSFVFQFLPVTVFYAGFYANLKYKYMQPWRWLEYSISASVMVLIFGTLNGIRNVLYLQTLFAANFTVMLLGLVQEYFMLSYKSGNVTNLTFIEVMFPHLLGWVLFLSTMASFMVLFSYSVENSVQNPPGWIYAIYATQFILFGCFGANQLSQQLRLYKNKKAEKCQSIAIQHEFVYVSLSLTAKSLLCWILYANMIAVKSVGGSKGSGFDRNCTAWSE